MSYIERSKDNSGLVDYFTDTECNRRHGELTTIVNSDANVLKITCDPILQSRGRLNPDDMMAIEIKKEHHKQTDN